jgi:hypothetical protein
VNLGDSHGFDFCNPRVSVDELQVIQQVTEIIRSKLTLLMIVLEVKLKLSVSLFIKTPMGRPEPTPRRRSGMLGFDRVKPTGIR